MIPTNINDAKQYLVDLVAKHGKVEENQTLTDTVEWMVAYDTAEDAHETYKVKDWAYLVLSGMPPQDDEDINEWVWGRLYDQDTGEPTPDGEQEIIDFIKRHFGTTGE
jgi:hypothetical protein